MPKTTPAFERRTFRFAIESRGPNADAPAVDPATPPDPRIHFAGHANTWEPAVILDYEERFTPGAFLKTLSERDILALYNHKLEFLLGRTHSPGPSLELAEDDIGLACRIHAEPTTYAKDLELNTRAGNVKAMSITFRAIRQDWTDPRRRIIHEAALKDVSPVVDAAYSGTDFAVEARASAAWAALARSADGRPMAPETRAAIESLIAELTAALPRADAPGSNAHPPATQKAYSRLLIARLGIRHALARTP